MAVNFLRRGISDSPVIHPNSTGTAVAFRQVGRHRASRADHLIGNRLQWCRHPDDEPDGYASSFDALSWAMSLVSGTALDMITSGSFMPPSTSR